MDGVSVLLCVGGASFRVNKPFSLSPFSQLADAETPACFPATVEQKPFGAETATVCHWTPRKSIDAAVCNTCSYTEGGGVMPYQRGGGEDGLSAFWTCDRLDDHQHVKFILNMVDSWIAVFCRILVGKRKVLVCGPVQLCSAHAS